MDYRTQTSQLSSKELIKLKLIDDLGPNLYSALQDPLTIELMVNDDGRVWQEYFNQTARCIDQIKASQTEAIIRTVSSFHQQNVNAENPRIEAEFPLFAGRFAGHIPPTVRAPILNIRKPSEKLFVLGDLYDQGIFKDNQLEEICLAIKNQENILVVGGTSSGKTTLLKAILAESVHCFPNQRPLILEEIRELQCPADNYAQLLTSRNCNMGQLLQSSLLLRPDRIIMGEVRGPEALDLLMAWNTGHEGGLATLHANDARNGLQRLESLISMHPYRPQNIATLIANVVHLVIYIKKTPEGRKIQEMIKVIGATDNKIHSVTL